MVLFKTNETALDSSKPIMRYLMCISDYGMLYQKSIEGCVGFTDADWAGDLNDYSGTTVSWKSRKQTCVALSGQG